MKTPRRKRTLSPKRVDPPPPTSPHKRRASSPLQPESLSPISLMEEDGLLGSVSLVLEHLRASAPSVQTAFLHQLLSHTSHRALCAFVSLALNHLRTDVISQLPIEIVFQIMAYCPSQTILKCLRVCKQWNTLLLGPGSELGIWKKRLCLEKWYDEEEIALAIQPPFTKSNPPPHLYISLFRKHSQITQNWYLGKYRRISFPGHSNHVVTCLQFDSQKIVSGSDDATIHIYDTQSGTLLKRLTGHLGGVWALQYWNDILVSGSTDRFIRVWNIKDGSCRHIFAGHTSTVRCLLIIPPTRQADGSFLPTVPLIVTGSRDSSLRIWKLPDPEKDVSFMDTENAGGNPYLLHVLEGHSNSVRAIAGSDDTLVSGSYDASVRIWDLSTGKCRFHLTGHQEKVYSVGYCAEIERAVSGSMDSTVRIWCTRTGLALYNLTGHASLVGLLEISPKYLVSAAADATLRIWDPMTGRCLANLTGHSAAITCFHHDPHLNRIVSGSDGGVKSWELSAVGPGTGAIPPTCNLSQSLTHSQSPFGREPIQGRFMTELITEVQGVWRIRMDAYRVVAAVQREGGRTWFEVLDFSHVGTPEHVQGVGDGDEEGGFSDQEEDELEDE